MGLCFLSHALVVCLLGAAGGALALGLVVHSGLSLHTGQLGIDEDTAAIFAYQDLLVHLDVELSLWRNLVEAATTGVALHIHDTQSVAGTLANALEAGQQARLDLSLKLTGLGFQVFLLLAGLLHDFLQFVALVL